MTLSTSVGATIPLPKWAICHIGDPGKLEAVLVIDRPSPERLLEGVRRARVTDVELVVLRSSSAQTAAAHRALVSRVNVVDSFGPSGSPAGVGVVERTTTIPLDSLTVELDVVGDRLVVRVDER